MKNTSAAVLLSLGLSMPIFSASAQLPGNSCGSNCDGSALGSAADFDVFVFENFSAPSGDVEGRLAAGQDVELSNYSVGDKLELSFTRSDLIVGRNLIFRSGTVMHGGISYGNTYDGLADTPVLTHEVALPFNQIQNELTQKSLQIHSIMSNATPFIQYTGERAFVTFEARSGQNVFAISSNDLSHAHTLEVKAPMDATIIINVDGSSASLSNFAMILTGGVSARNILFNFYQAQSIFISNIAVEGSILAPHARITFPSGQMNGQLVAYSFTGSGQINHVPNSGSCIPTTPTDYTRYVRDHFLDGANDHQIGGNVFEIYGMVFKQIGDRVIVGFNSNFPLNGSTYHGGNIGWGDFVFNFSSRQNEFSSIDRSKTYAVKFAVRTGSDQAAPHLGLYRNVQVRGNEAEHDGYRTWGAYLNEVHRYQSGNTLGGISDSYFNLREATPNSIAVGTWVPNADFQFLDAQALSAMGINFSNGLGAPANQLGSITFGFSFLRLPEMQGTFTGHVVLECSNDAIGFQDVLRPACQ